MHGVESFKKLVPLSNLNLALPISVAEMSLSIPSHPCPLLQHICHTCQTKLKYADSSYFQKTMGSSVEVMAFCTLSR